MSVNFILLLVIGIFSFSAFSHTELFYKFQLNPWSVVNRKQYYRAFTHGFLHADWMHLIVNLFVLYSFGNAVIFYFSHYLGGYAEIRFLIFFLSALPFSSLYSIIKYRNNSNYNAIGASGAVSAVVFASIFFAPYTPILLFAVIPIPGILFGVVYLAYSAYMSKKQIDNIGHDVHFWGAVYGIIFPLITDPSLINLFMKKLLSF